MEQIEEHTRLLHGTPAATAAASAFRTARQSPSGLLPRTRNREVLRWTYRFSF
jgi:hypothetical protein